MCSCTVLSKVSLISSLYLLSALEALINFAYNGHVAIDQQNVQALLIGASFLQLQNVKDACCSFLQERYPVFIPIVFCYFLLFVLFRCGSIQIVKLVCSEF